MSVAAETIDLSVLQSYRELQQEGEPDLVSELIELYLNDTQVRLAELNAALRQKDSKVLKDVTHSLKGSSRNVGALQMQALCSDLEDKLVEGTFEQRKALVTRLEEEFARVLDALEGEHKRRGPEDSGANAGG